MNRAQIKKVLQNLNTNLQTAFLEAGVSLPIDLDELALNTANALYPTWNSAGLPELDTEG